MFSQKIPSFIGKPLGENSRNLNTFKTLQTKKVSVENPHNMSELLSLPWSPFAPCGHYANGSVKFGFSTVVLQFENSKWSFDDGLKWVLNFNSMSSSTLPQLILLGPKPDWVVGFDEERPHDFFICFFLPFCSTDLKIYRLLETTLEQLVPCKKRADAASIPVVTQIFPYVRGCTQKGFLVTDFDAQEIRLKNCGDSGSWREGN